MIRSETLLCLLLVTGCAGPTAKGRRVSESPVPNTQRRPAPEKARQAQQEAIVFQGNHALSDRMLRSRISKHGRVGIDLGSVIVYNAYYNAGYAAVQVEGQAHPATGKLHFKVKEGARFRLGELSIREKPASTDALGQPATLRARLSLRTGMWFDRSQLVHAVEKLLIHYRDAGYGQAEAHPVINLDAERKAVDLDFLIERGPKVVFGEIKISGLDTVPEGEIKQHVLVRRGQRYSHTNLEETRRRLMQTGLFSQVSISVNKPASQPTAVAEASAARLDVSIEIVRRLSP